MASATNKKPRHAPPLRGALTTPPTETTQLAALPPALLENVLHFLTPDDALVEMRHGIFHCELDTLSMMARVCHEWRTLVNAAASQRVLRSVYIRHQMRDPWGPQGTRSDMLEVRRQLILRRAYVQRIVLGDSPDYGVNGMGVWGAALSHVPRLQALEMDTFYIEGRPSDRIADVVRAAARHCKSLEKLTIPSEVRDPRDREDDERERPRPRGHHMRVLSKAVYDGLKVWSKGGAGGRGGGGGGLRHLRFPMHEIMKSIKDAKTYLTNVVTYCPRIERLDGSAPHFHESGMLVAEEFWKLDLDTWDRFCRVCDRLVVVDWRCLPFATAFFEIFGRYMRPKLRYMALSASGNWTWDAYFKAVDNATEKAVKATGYGASAVRPETALRATPNLHVLRVQCTNGSWGRRDDKLDPEIFGDDFVVAAVGLCKHLTHVTHCAVAVDGNGSVTTFTDRALRALATLPDLEWVDLVAVNVTGDGLFDLVFGHTARTRQTRQYFLHLGGKPASNGSTAMVFYDVLADFLQRLVDFKDAELPCATRPVTLHLINLNAAFVDEGWSAAYFGHVLQLAEQAQLQHPTLQLCGLVRGYNDEFGVMKRVLEFVVATESATLPDWQEDKGDVEARDEEVDRVFVNRSYYGDDSDED